ncbi:MAG: tetratricopeptide repeat protein, partial [Pyrinomonadaceae bacterium]
MIKHPVRDIFSQLPFRLRRSVLALTILSFIALPIFANDDIKPISDDPKSLVKQGEKLIRRGDFAGAEQLFKRAIEARPSDSEIKLKLAFLYVKTRRFVEAYELAFPIARDEPKNSFAFAVVGSTYLGAGRFKDARLLLVNSLRIKNDQPLAWAGLGMLDFYENKISESLRNLQEAVFYQPFEPDFVYALAQVSARAEKYKEAAQAYEDFLRVSRNTDDERRARIKGLINFLRYLGNKQ